ncbi:MAG: O-acetylhomoserine aminocarboxypropyltransferase/cysteine synthase family protein [Campylobacterota bacterium]
MKANTKALHFGYEKDSQGTMAVPIYQSSAYEFQSTQHAANLFQLKELGNIYSRLTNPTTEVFEKRFASVEEGVGAIATSSGMAAIFAVIANLCEAGDNIICSNRVYGGTTTLTAHTIKRFGIEARYFDIDDTQQLETLIDEKTKVILFESIANPSVAVADFDAIVQIADAKGVVTACDNTVATPMLCRPIAHGVDLVMHSTSKYTTGQGLAIGGIVVESESFKQKISSNSKYAHFNTPDASYHGLIYTDTPLPPFSLRARLALLRDFGIAPSPFNSWLFIQGLETLDVRMARHCQNAMKVAQFLHDHPKVKRVNYPGLQDDKYYALAQKYCSGASSVMSFELQDFSHAQEVANSVEIFSLVANIGDSKSIITHPASTTHQQLSKEELQSAGISEGLIRLSVGLEDAQDLIEDLQKALG